MRRIKVRLPFGLPTRLPFRRRGLQFGRQRRKMNTTLLREIGIWAVEILIVLMLAFTFVFFIGQRTRVIGNSMEPQFADGDQLLINRFVYVFVDPKPNDIIVFRPNGNEKSHYYVKRVVACPGDRVQIIDGALYVNGELFDEEIAAVNMEYAGIADEELELGKGEFFVLGDNRNNSEDSRYANIGTVNKKFIVGKAWFVTSPLSKFGFIK